jgi:hypothetical protein
MRAVSIAAALWLAPALGAAQSGAVDAARQARQTAQDATQRRQSQADAQAAQGQEPPAQEPAPVDLGPAAERLEAPGELEGTGAPPPPGGAVPPPDTYTVKPGDTLWDLSGRFLNNPWYWPKVWSYNPELTNPHWISPGNVIRFFPGAEEAPARVEPVVPPEAAEPTAELEAPKELEDMSKADMGKAQDYGEEDAVAVTGPYKVGYVAPKGTLGRRDTFVTVRELEESGVISAAFEDKLLLSVQDRLYARFHDPAVPKVGQTYVIFRTTRAVEHPRTHERIGYQTSIIGTVRAVAKDEKATTLVVTQASEAIERGDYVGPLADRVLKMVPRRPNQREMRGLIVSSEREATWLAAEHHLVFVDKGRADGVEEGNVFTVTRAGDPYGQPVGIDNLATREDLSYPSEVIGELLVVDAKENFSTALVVRSLRELYAGDRVEMRLARSAAAVPQAN